MTSSDSRVGETCLPTNAGGRETDAGGSIRLPTSRSLRCRWPSSMAGRPGPSKQPASMSRPTGSSSTAAPLPFRCPRENAAAAFARRIDVRHRRFTLDPLNAATRDARQCRHLELAVTGASQNLDFVPLEHVDHPFPRCLMQRDCDSKGPAQNGQHSLRSVRQNFRKSRRQNLRNPQLRHDEIPPKRRARRRTNPCLPAIRLACIERSLMASRPRGEWP